MILRDLACLQWPDKLKTWSHYSLSTRNLQWGLFSFRSVTGLYLRIIAPRRYPRIRFNQSPSIYSTGRFFHGMASVSFARNKDFDSGRRECLWWYLTSRSLMSEEYLGESCTRRQYRISPFPNQTFTRYFRPSSGKHPYFPIYFSLLRQAACAVQLYPLD